MERMTLPIKEQGSRSYVQTKHKRVFKSEQLGLCLSPSRTRDLTKSHVAPETGKTEDREEPLLTQKSLLMRSSGDDAGVAGYRLRFAGRLKGVSHQAKLHIPSGEVFLSPISWMRKSRLRQVKPHHQSHTAGKRQRRLCATRGLSGISDTRFHIINLGSSTSSPGPGTKWVLSS